MEKTRFKKDESIPRSDLVRIDRNIRFVIKQDNGLILNVFHNSIRKKALRILVKEYGKDKMRENRYGDILIL